MAHPIGEVPHAGLEPDLFERFHREMVDIKNNRKYTYTQRLYDKGYSKSEMQSKRTAINSKYNQKSLAALIIPIDMIRKAITNK